MLEEIKELAMAKLNSLNIDLIDDIKLDFFINEAQIKLKNMLSLQELPQETLFLLSDMVAGLFLENTLVLEDGACGTVSSITEGEISLSYKNGTSLWEKAVELANPSEFKLSPFRRIIW